MRGHSKLFLCAWSLHPEKLEAYLIVAPRFSRSGALQGRRLPLRESRGAIGAPHYCYTTLFLEASQPGSRACEYAQ